MDLAYNLWLIYTEYLKIINLI